MKLKSWTVLLLLAGFLWRVLVCKNSASQKGNERLKKRFEAQGTIYIAVDKFRCFIDTRNHSALVFLRENGGKKKFLPYVRTKGASRFLHLRKWHTQRNTTVYVLQGSQCNDTFNKLTGDTNMTSTPVNGTCDFNQNDTATCQVRCFNLLTICQGVSDGGNSCSQMWGNYINLTATQENCYCHNPVKKPDKKMNLELTPKPAGENIRPKEAVQIMNKVAEIASSLNESAVELSGQGVSGVILAVRDPVDIEDITFACISSPNENLNIIQGKSVNSFQRSITVSKEAFEKAFNPNASLSFAAVMRFANFPQDEHNSTVLGGEVLAVDMGTEITNLRDKINIHFENMTYEGIPSCRSWNSEGLSPHWIDDGCETVFEGDQITCQCSHLTFFAILLIPLNETVSSSDLNNLTIITQVGCGLSMFFLAIVLFMHFLLRRTKATDTTKILIHLVSAMFLLNLTFLINSHAAKMKSSLGCEILAALMHYFMLATFTWFAVQAFHLCLQMYSRGQIVIQHYVLKVSVTSWGIPCVVVIVLLSVGKYGEQVIHTDAGANNVTMCWITDGNVQLIVNIGYYALIFLFTFSTFIVILTWFCCLRSSNSGNAQVNRNGMSMMTIMGLCCLLGITWGFVFFAHGPLRIPSYYIFTVLNSFQGFFLFIYYYTNSNTRVTSTGPSADVSSNSSSTTTTVPGNGVRVLENPYGNLSPKKD